MEPISRQILIGIHAMNPNYPQFQLPSTPTSFKGLLIFLISVEVVIKFSWQETIEYILIFPHRVR